ncbi:hypothetical protein [Candidatus Poriferisodalis sp.]|uniref:hypothetical protein n=1 Tax=Candidatus Poriferisodalis sp. TaxID=3101277 RepID=UPI003B01DDF9
MRNVTVSLDDETARWARIEAARHDSSLSRFVCDVLRERMQDRGQYERAAESYLSRESMPRREVHQPYPTRDELHSR